VQDIEEYAFCLRSTVNWVPQVPIPFRDLGSPFGSSI
jgi:hypothetical protein